MASTRMAAPIAHLVAVEVSVGHGPGSMIARMRQGTVVSVLHIEMIVYMAIEMSGTMKPGAGADKDATGKPFRPVVAIGGATVGRVIVITIGANRRWSNVDRNLCLRFRAAENRKAPREKSYQKVVPKETHRFTSKVRRGAGWGKVVLVGQRKPRQQAEIAFAAQKNFLRRQPLFDPANLGSGDAKFGLAAAAQQFETARALFESRSSVSPGISSASGEKSQSPPVESFRSNRAQPTNC